MPSGILHSEENANVITTKQLQTQYTIIGPLGCSVDKVVSFEAVAEYRDGKVDNNWLRVTSVDGKRLDQPIEITYGVYRWANVTQLEYNRNLTLNVYQDLRYLGTRDGVMEQTTAVSDPWKFGLYTSIVVVNQVQPRELKHPNPYYKNMIGGNPFDRPKKPK